VNTTDGGDKEILTHRSNHRSGTLFAHQKGGNKINSQQYSRNTSSKLFDPYTVQVKTEKAIEVRPKPMVKKTKKPKLKQSVERK
jgi:hypothetical protein